MKTYRTPNLFTQLVTGLQIAFFLLPANAFQLRAQSVTVTRVAVNQGDPSRSAVTNLTVTFSTNVTIVPPGLAITDPLTGTNLLGTNVLLSYDAVARSATWTFPGLPGGSLPQGNWMAGLPAPAVRPDAGSTLAGTPGGQPGDPLVFDLHRYFGDVNGDRDVDFADTYWLKRSWLLASNQPGFDSRLDLTGDGFVNSNDLPGFLTNYFTLLPPQPGIFAALANDTGLSATDSITDDPTIAGAVVVTNAATRLFAALEYLGPEGSEMSPWTDVSSPLSRSRPRFIPRRRPSRSVAAPDASFRFDSNRLAQIRGAALELGTNRLHLELRQSGVTASAAFTVPFILQPQCAFPEINDCRIAIAPPLAGGTAGSVTFPNCEAVLTEGDSFTVTLEKPLTIPASGILAIRYQIPSFDGTATNLMRDAFEVALLDAQGKALSFTIQGPAGVTPASAAVPVTLPATPDTCSTTPMAVTRFGRLARPLVLRQLAVSNSRLI